MFLSDGHVDVDLAKDGAAFLVVTTVDVALHEIVAYRDFNVLTSFLVFQNLTSDGVFSLFFPDGVINQVGITAVVFNIGLVNITGKQRLSTIGSAEDASYMYG